MSVVIMIALQNNLESGTMTPLASFLLLGLFFSFGYLGSLVILYRVYSSIWYILKKI